MKDQYKEQLRKIASNLLKVAVEKDQVQYFSFYPDHFDASDIVSNLEKSASSDWDYALVQKDGKLTSYIYMGDDAKSRWSTISVGSNPWKLLFVSPGVHTYENYEKFKRLAK